MCSSKFCFYIITVLVTVFAIMYGHFIQTAQVDSVEPHTISLMKALYNDVDKSKRAEIKEIVVFGAFGALGKTLVWQAVDLFPNAHIVVTSRRSSASAKDSLGTANVFGIRDASQLRRLSFRQADAEVLADVRATITEKTDIVFSALGESNLFSSTYLYSNSFSHFVSAIRDAGGNAHLVVCTAAGVKPGMRDAYDGHFPFIYEVIFRPLLLQRIYDDMERAEAILKDVGSKVSYTIVKPVGLGHAKHGHGFVVYGFGPSVPGDSVVIERSDVAKMMIYASLRRDEFQGKEVAIRSDN